MRFVEVTLPPAIGEDVDSLRGMIRGWDKADGEPENFPLQQARDLLERCDEHIKALCICKEYALRQVEFGAAMLASQKRREKRDEDQQNGPS